MPCYKFLLIMFLMFLRDSKIIKLVTVRDAAITVTVVQTPRDKVSFVVELERNARLIILELKGQIIAFGLFFFKQGSKKCFLGRAVKGDKNNLLFQEVCKEEFKKKQWNNTQCTYRQCLKLISLMKAYAEILHRILAHQIQQHIRKIIYYAVIVQHM